jgi:CRP-like cAMP-binding protein
MFGTETLFRDTHGVPAARIEMLRRLPMFASYTDEELVQVDALVYETTLPAGARLTVEGHVRRQAFIILAGSASIEMGRKTIGEYSFGDMVGEMSLLDHGPQNSTVTALSPLRVLVMDPREFVTLMSDPRAARWLAGDLTERLREAQVRTAVPPQARRHTVPGAAVHVPA